MALVGVGWLYRLGAEKRPNSPCARSRARPACESIGHALGETPRVVSPILGGWAGGVARRVGNLPSGRRRESIGSAREHNRRARTRWRPMRESSWHTVANASSGIRSAKGGRNSAPISLSTSNFALHIPRCNSRPSDSPPSRRTRKIIRIYV